MAITRCPGQDTKVWTERDIYEVECPKCGKTMEFWKDDQSRKCEECGEEVINPRFASAEQPDEVQAQQ